MKIVHWTSTTTEIQAEKATSEWIMGRLFVLFIWRSSDIHLLCSI